MTTADDEKVRAEVRQEIDTATDAAESAPLPAPEDALLHVYGEGGPSGDELSGLPRVSF